LAFGDAEVIGTRGRIPGARMLRQECQWAMIE
jgi:hypothetical protein